MTLHNDRMGEGMSEQDDYIESRFELNERMKTLTKEQLIRLVNRLMNEGDERELIITDEEINEIMETGKEDQEDGSEGM